MIKRLTFCINHFLVWSTCMLNFFHWKDRQTKQWCCFMIITKKSKIDVCKYLSVFVCLLFINFMLNNAHLLLLAYAFVSRFDYYSVYGSFNKDVLINLPKSWFISCFHFLLPCLKFAGFPRQLFLDCWYRAHWYWTARNVRKRNEFSLVKNCLRYIIRSDSETG